jgi:LytS/YehU family sensor histidine kinase
MKIKVRKKAQTQQQILKLKADALAAQMNPHFVFNCISSINALINLGDKQEASLYLGQFASLLRSVLKSVRVNEISLEEELSITEKYMQLEQARYSNPFKYEIIRPEGISITSIMVPPMLIQPFVENAILHGFTRIPNYEKRINILALISGGRLKVVIKDNGLGIVPDNQTEPGLGIKITKERIALLENNAQVHIESHVDEDHHGTTVTIEIPLKIKKTEND